jgi:rare lipoprotein A (peptidoglycan hydrolase)
MGNHRSVVVCGSRFAIFFGLFCAVLFTSACGRKSVRTPAMVRVKIGYEQRGIASWYGHPYHGRATASGEIYDMERLTAAHPRLPFGVTTRVENLANGKTVDVRINDRGPFKKGRIIDLSRAAAREIDLLGPGTAEVRIKVIAAPANVRAQTDHGQRSRFAFLLHPLRRSPKQGHPNDILTLSRSAGEGAEMMTLTTPTGSTDSPHKSGETLPLRGRESQ